MVTTVQRKVALYSHDSQGLGHIRRNLELAAALVCDYPRTEVMLIGSAAGADRLPLPPSTRLELVPRVTKDPAGGYAPAEPGGSLDRTLALRGRAVSSLLRRFGPDLFVVDKLARGLGGELDEPLRAARHLRGPSGRRTRVVLGLRDVLDAPAVARQEWQAAGTTDAVLEHYDQIWVYGDPSVYDPVLEYDLPAEVAGLVRHTGYLARGRGRHRPVGAGSEVVPATPYVLGLVGGGQDGAALADAFTSAPLPPGHTAVLVCGPQMPTEQTDRLRARAEARDDLEIHTFLPDPTALVRCAAAVVTMGGYNTVCEVLASRRPALVVPRVAPRLEQAVRATHLSATTHLETLDPAEATPGALGEWLLGAVGRPVPHPAIDLDGLARVPALVDWLLSTHETATEEARALA